MASCYVKQSVDNSIGKIQFFHPVSNSLPSEMLGQLVRAFEELSGRLDCKVIILESEGTDIFCAGANFNELISVSNLEEANHFFSGFAKL